jgi:chaperonin GroES
MALRPLDDRVVVKEIETPTVSPGGIALPGTSKEKPQRGTVVAIGPGRASTLGNGSGRIPMSVKVGDEVVFTAYAGSDVEVGGEKLRIFSEKDILAVVDA